MAKADAEAVLDAPEGEHKEGRRNRPPKNKPPRRRPERETEESPTFWQKVSEVAKADWGPRANIYVYRIEPMIDRARSGNNNYIMKYAEPISEDRILADHGSGKYKLMLNFRKPGADQGDEVDSLYIDVLNLQYPPKVPPGEWVDDPRNKKWAWAKQHFPREGGTERPSETIRETLQLADAIRGTQAPVDPVKTTLDTIRGVKDLMGETPKKNPTDDLATVVSVAKDLAALQRQPEKDDGMQTFLLQELAAQRAQTDKLMMMLLDPKKANDNGGFGAIKQVTDGLKELLPAVKEFFPNLGDSVGTGGGGSRLNGWQEFAVALGNSPLVTGVVNPFASVLAQVMMAKLVVGGGQQQPAQQPAGQRQPATQPALPAANMPPFIEMIAPPMMNYIRNMALPGYVPAELGHDFGSWVFDGYGGDARYGEALMALKTMGPAGILAAMQSTPQLWNNKGPNGMLASPADLQAKLPEFFTAFLAYDPNAEPNDQEEEETDEPPQVVAFNEASA